MSGKCFDMEMGKRVILRPQEDGVDEQIWYEDRNSQIRNKVADAILDLQGTVATMISLTRLRSFELLYILPGVLVPQYDVITFRSKFNLLFIY